VDQAGAPARRVQALKRQPAPKATPRLSEQERTRLSELLERGAPAYGFREEVWTSCERVAQVIGREFGVHTTSGPRASSAAGVGPLPAKAFSPGRHQREEEEEAIERWKEEKWPSLKRPSLKGLP
jgi:transposase